VTDTADDIRFMERALELAVCGRGSVSPNPMVGAVVVRDRRIVGEGWHKKAGGAHAEVIALKEAGSLARGATLYVTLEPCCHYGKTPPCTDALIKYGVSRVVAAMVDDNPMVCGGGCQALGRAGIKMETGLLEDRARRLNEAYLKFITQRLPFVTLKLAVTLDGYIADTSGGSKWITGPEARRAVHRMRAWSDAVMVGAGTVAVDDPRLNVRDAEGCDPVRIVVDSRFRLPFNRRVFHDGYAIVVSGDTPDEEKTAQAMDRGIRVIRAGDGVGGVNLEHMLTALGERNITSVLCEGGSILSSSLIRQRLVDKVVFFIAPKLLGQGRAALDDIGVTSIGESIRLDEVVFETVGGDLMVAGYPVYSDSDTGNVK